jgi:hypothetical protein
MTIQDLVIRTAERECDSRPFRLENESKEDYRKALGSAAPAGPFAVDLVPDLSALSAFITALTTARLTNLDRDALEVEYRKGLWDDAWDGFFYHPALLISHVLAYDAGLAEVAEFAGSLRHFHGVRAFRKGPYLFLKKGPMEASYVGNAITLPVDALSAASDDPNLADLSAIFGSNLIGDLRTWLSIEPARREVAASQIPAPQAFDVFLSHSSKDSLRAKELADALTAAGKRVFFSPDSLPALGSADYMKAIDNALEGSRHFILFGTKKENILSSWVEAEWRLFINEMRSGRKSGNFLTAIGGDLAPGELPLSLRYYEVIPAEGNYIARVLQYVT